MADRVWGTNFPSILVFRRPLISLSLPAPSTNQQNPADCQLPKSFQQTAADHPPVENRRLAKARQKLPDSMSCPKSLFVISGTQIFFSCVVVIPMCEQVWVCNQSHQLRHIILPQATPMPHGPAFSAHHCLPHRHSSDSFLPPYFLLFWSFAIHRSKRHL